MTYCGSTNFGLSNTASLGLAAYSVAFTANMINVANEITLNAVKFTTSVSSQLADEVNGSAPDISANHGNTNSTKSNNQISSNSNQNSPYSNNSYINEFQNAMRVEQQRNHDNYYSYYARL